MEARSDIYTELEKSIRNGDEAALVSAASVRACAPAETAVRMLVKADGTVRGSIGGGEVEENVVTLALDIIKAGKSRRIRIGVSPQEESRRGMEPGGKLKYFVEPVRLIPHLYLFGAGELSLQIARFASLLRYRITVVDVSSEYTSQERFPGMEVVVDKDYRRALENIKFDPESYIVIATRNHEYEELVLELSLQTGIEYIGMAACSEEKKKRYLTHMAQKGYSTERLQSVHATIGLEIHAQTMEEIALSIMAEIVGIIRSVI